MIRALIFGCITIGVALIALLFRASSNNEFYAEHYPWLFGLGLVLTIGLLLLIGYQIYLLVKKLRTRVFGSKLALRLMTVFALMAIIPGGLVYAISVQFLSRSIDSWFDVPVDKALEGAVNLGKSVLDSTLTETLRKGREAAMRIAARDSIAIVADTDGARAITNDDKRSLSDAETLRQLRIQYGFDEITLFAMDGRPLASASLASTRAPIFIDKPNTEELRDAVRKAPIKQIETLSDRSIYSRVLISVPPATTEIGPRVLQVVQAVPANIVADAKVVESGRNDYLKLGLQRDGLKRLFALTLTLTLLLTLFSAIALSFFLSEKLSAPLSALAESTRAIAKGDFSKLNPVRSRDEFGVLTQSFNTMTRQLGEASDVVARKQQELENANTYLESILAHLTSGVMTLDERLYVKTINSNAEKMLGFNHHALRGLKLPEWGETQPQLQPLIEEITKQLATPRDKPWERQIAYEGPVGRRTLLVRATKLPTTIDSGFVFVFDDITGLIQAQRDAAWGEVARRLAHEIKNPLTPIQLSAERLQMKLTGKLPAAEQDILLRSTNTIVAQVGALKGMVDDFSLYSRSSRLKPVMLSLNELARDVLVLYESMTVFMDIRLDSNLPMISADPALLRQVLHNLIQNALDASAGAAKPCIILATAVGGDGDNYGDQSAFVRLSVEDNGSGISEDVKTRIFEPYVTTKSKGTGLGLAIVKKIVDEHHGTISVINVKPTGARVEIELPLQYIPLGEEMVGNSTFTSLSSFSGVTKQ